MNGDVSYTKRRKIYASHPVNMAGVVVRKFMFSNKKKVIGILFSLSIGGCIFLCTTYMIENLKIHAELSLKSEDGLGSEYRISLRSTSLNDTIPEDEFLDDEDWSEYFEYQNQDSYFVQRYGGICLQQEDGTYAIKYDVYGYDEELLKQLQDFVLEGEIHPPEMESRNQVVVVANMDGQENYTDEWLKFQSGQEH